MDEIERSEESDAVGYHWGEYFWQCSIDCSTKERDQLDREFSVVVITRLLPLSFTYSGHWLLWYLQCRTLLPRRESMVIGHLSKSYSDLIYCNCRRDDLGLLNLVIALLWWCIQVERATTVRNATENHEHIHRYTSLTKLLKTSGQYSAQGGRTTTLISVPLHQSTNFCTGR